MAERRRYNDSDEEGEERGFSFSEDDEDEENHGSDEYEYEDYDELIFDHAFQYEIQSDRGSSGVEETDDDEEFPYKPPSPPRPPPPRKRRRITPSHADSKESNQKTLAGPDRISELPESIILHILSFLPMNDVVKTGTLSKKWQYLWTSVENISFSYRNRQDEKRVQKFISFVDETLVLCTHSNIKKFCLDFEYHRRFVSNINIWVRFAWQKNVKELDLNFYTTRPGHRYRLPQYVYKNSALVKLCLSKCKIMPYRIVDWRSLRVLTIKCAGMDDGTIRKFLKGSPVLEYLELYRCWVQGSWDTERSVYRARFSICSGSLKKLVIRGYRCPYDGGDADVWEISAPTVLSLEIRGCLRFKKIRLVNVSSLVDVKLDFYQGVHEMLMDFLTRLQHVRVLTLGSWCIQVLSMQELKGLPSPLLECKSLTLVTQMKRCDFPGIARLLQSSPDLETLVINVDSSDSFELESVSKFLNSCDFDGESYWTSKKSVFKHLLLHLKTVKVVGFMPVSCEFELAILQTLLEKARVLEKMVIGAGMIGCKEYLGSPEFLQMTQRLSSFTRSSPNAVIMFPELLK